MLGQTGLSKQCRPRSDAAEWEHFFLFGKDLFSEGTWFAGKQANRMMMMNWDFTSFSNIFKSYLDDKGMIMKALCNEVPYSNKLKTISSRI